MTTTSCNVSEGLYPQSEVRTQIDEWLSAHEGELTHFVTLTFDAKRIDELIDRTANYRARNDPALVELYQRSMRHFLSRLQKKLYGNLAERGRSRLLFIPILEGLTADKVPHYHCLVRVCADRFDQLALTIKDCWQRVQFAGHQIDVQTYRDRGCLIYSAKSATSLTRESVDWLNIQLPNRSSRIAE